MWSSLAPPPCSHSHEIGSACDAQRYGLCHVRICRGADKRRRRSRIKRIWRRCGEIFVGFMSLPLPLGCVGKRVWLQSDCVTDGLLFQSFPCQSLQITSWQIHSAIIFPSHWSDSSHLILCQVQQPISVHFLPLVKVKDQLQTVRIIPFL